MKIFFGFICLLLVAIGLFQLAPESAHAAVLAGSGSLSLTGLLMFGTVSVFDEVKDLFEAFRKANDARIDNLEAKFNRPGCGPAAENELAIGITGGKEYRDSFNAFVRRGDMQAALSTGSDPNGGYAVPTQLDGNMIKLAANAAPMRQVCNVVPISTPNYSKLVDKKGATSGWVGETDARPETDTPQLAALTPFMGELYANPATTQQMLDDAVFNVETWLAESLVEKFAADENTAFTSGNGVLKAKGFLAYPTAATTDATRAFGTLQHVVTGAAADFATASATVSPADVLFDLVHSLKAAYRLNAVFMLNSLTLGKVRTFKDTDGRFIYQQSLIAGQPSTLLGYPVVENEDMADVGAGAFPIAFGDFKRGYTIVDRIGTRVLRDPFTNKPYVHFYTTKRVGGFLADSNAIKLLKVAAN
jgi:HK97 family phage major capsid protein